MSITEQTITAADAAAVVWVEGPRGYWTGTTADGSEVLVDPRQVGARRGWAVAIYPHNGESFHAVTLDRDPRPAAAAMLEDAIVYHDARAAARARGAWTAPAGMSAVIV